MCVILIPGECGPDLDVVTAIDKDIRNGKDIVDKNGDLLTGTMKEKVAQIYSPSTSDQVIVADQFIAGAQIIKGDGNLIPNNILSGKSIFGVVGNVVRYRSFQATISTSGSGWFNLTGGQLYSANLLNISGFGFTPFLFTAINTDADQYLALKGPYHFHFSRYDDSDLSAFINRGSSVWGYNQIIAPVMRSGTYSVMIVGF